MHGNYFIPIPVTKQLREYMAEQFPTHDHTDATVRDADAKAFVFGIELTKINPDFVDKFVQAFMDEYFMDKIGLETLALFRFRLASRVRMNADLINEIFSMFGTKNYTKMVAHAMQSKNIPDGINGIDKITSLFDSLFIRYS